MRWVHVYPFTSSHAVYSSPGDKREWAVVTPDLFSAGLTASGKGSGGRQSITGWNSEVSGKLQARPGRVQRGPGRGTRTGLRRCAWREPELWVPSTGVELLDSLPLASHSASLFLLGLHNSGHTHLTADCLY